MKSGPLLLAALFCSCAAPDTHRSLAAGPVLAINVLENYADADQARRSPEALAAVRLVPEPVIFDKDFVYFDATNGFAITAESAKRLYLRLNDHNVEPFSGREIIPDWPDTPFVLSANGQRVYSGVMRGMLTSRLSSRLYLGAVTVLPEGVYTNSSHSICVKFTVSFYHPTDARTDPRQDSRLMTAIQALRLDGSLHGYTESGVSVP